MHSYNPLDNSSTAVQSTPPMSTEPPTVSPRSSVNSSSLLLSRFEVHIPTNPFVASLASKESSR